MSRKKSEQYDLETLREEALHCRACDLWKHATQTVFGEGPLDASIMFVGEQPGDQEDLAGMLLGVLQEGFRARHARRRLDPALHALEQAHELGRDVAADLVVALIVFSS